jgi:aminopeptidase N
MSTHADHFNTNTAYYASAYSKGCVFLAQLEYIIGNEALQNTMLRYFNTWQFRHPGPEEFIHEAELTSGFVLDWYYEYWVFSTKTIDYTVTTVDGDSNESTVKLGRVGAMPMPVEISVTTKRGTEFRFYIPLDLMRGSKQSTEERTVLPEWQWVNRSYAFTLPVKLSQIVKVQIDPSGRMADVDQSNNTFFLQSELD